MVNPSMPSAERALPHWRVAVIALVALLLPGLLIPGTAAAQQVSLQNEIANDIVSQGYWDESGSLNADEMASIVAEWGSDIAFAFTDREFEVAEDQTQNPAALLAQSALERVVSQGGPRTLFLVTDSHVGGASINIPFINVMTALDGFDRSNPVASFDAAAQKVTTLGNEIPEDIELPSTVVAQTGVFTITRIFILLAIVTGLLFLASVRSSRKKRSRKLYTADARDDTKAQIQAMSDLILDLDPRVTIENDPELKKRYVDASDTYRAVLEQADKAVTGHEVADLRIEIAKARWKLDVIDAELEGATPPPEPHTRDTSGSAWDSTRGDGA